MTLADDFDNPWKDILLRAFPELMAFYFPAAWARIDWNCEHVFLDKELRQVVREAELGRRVADALVRVRLRDGTEQWVYLHIEIQGQSDPAFAQRMFTYNCRLYDRYGRAIASFAILADDRPGWRPRGFALAQLGCTHRFRFPTVKLLDYRDRLAALEADPNPFALVTPAHLYTASTRHDPQGRYGFKRRLVGLLYRHRYERQRVLDLFALLDWMMRLPAALEAHLWQEIQQLEQEQNMPYVTSVERMASRRGWQQGARAGLQKGVQKGRLEGKLEGRLEGRLEGKLEGQADLLTRLLTRRFGPLPAAVSARLAQASAAELADWGERVIDAASLAEVFNGS